MVNNNTMNKKGIIMGNFIFALCITITVGFTFTLASKKEKDTETFKEKIDINIDDLTLDEKIGQMLIVSVPGTSLSSEKEAELKTYKPGGVILFSDNISTFDNTLALVESLENTASIPLFLGMDQEGGKVQRLLSLSDVTVSNIPPMAELGKTNDPSLAYDVGKVMAEELRTLHINMDFAPVVDVAEDINTSFIGNRSFGTDITQVSHMANALAQGLIDNDVIPVFKHFPGHGSTVTDSHYELPVIEKNEEELLKSDLIPFQNAIDAGAEVIMIGHLALPKLTNNNTPASLSKEIITDLLKNKLGYQGLVITDALNMKALTNYYTHQEIYEMAINAGVDLILMPQDITEAISLIKDSINKGTIKIEQINESVTKILKLKYQYISYDYPSKDVLNSAEHQVVINAIND